jgi:hypothetical protein
VSLFVRNIESGAIQPSAANFTEKSARRFCCLIVLPATKLRRHFTASDEGRVFLPAL